MKIPKFAVAALLLSLTLIIPAAAQKLRLRSQTTPACEATGTHLKFADVYADGNIAVMGSYGCRGAFIFDISNPDAPVLANHYNPGNSQQFLEAIVIGTRGYFGSGSLGGVHIVDLSDPYHPQLLGIVNAASGGGFASIHEMLVIRQNGADYLIENFNGPVNKLIKIINVTNPAAPVFVRDIAPTEVHWVHAMHVRGDRMYTSGWGNGTTRGRTEIYDIADIATRAPVLLGYIEDASVNVTAGNNMHSSWTSEDGDYLYSARETNDGTGDIRVYNVSDPAVPLLVKRITMQELGLNAITPHNPVVVGDLLYVSWYQAGLQVFDITDRTNPRRIAQYDTFQPAFTVSEAERKAAQNADPWDLICGSEFRQNYLPTTYDGLWAVYPFVGANRIVTADLTGGLIVLDASAVTQPAKNRVSDFDGDRRTDLSVFSPSTGQWLIESSLNGSTSVYGWGAPGDRVVTGDYDGDGRADTAVWRPSNGSWYIRGSSTGFWVRQFGQEGDVPVPADYDADGRTDIAVWRPSNGLWYIIQSTLGYRIRGWGVEGDKVMAGDFEGDGKADLVVWRPSNGMWYIVQSSSSIPIFANWGQEGDIPLLADFDGDGRSDYVIFRPSNGTWYIFNPRTGSFYSQPFGVEGDVPMPADLDGDGKADLTVYRPATGFWYSLYSFDGFFLFRPFGVPGDIPSPSSVQPQ